MLNKNQKPIVRWVIGEVHELGYELLYESITNFKKIYGDKFEYCICYNSKKIKKYLLKCLNLVNYTFDQTFYLKEFSYNPLNKKGPHWKLYPPRLFQCNHELILDNDLIIYKKLDEIEIFLNNKDMLITTQAVKRSYNKKYDNYIKKEFNINSGLVGLPPNFNYKQELQTMLNLGPGYWDEHLDEQTLVASVLQQQNTKIIPLKVISVASELTNYLFGEKGTHFVGTNGGFDKYWKHWKNVCVKYL
jgi:hypothetical protein